MLEKEEDDELMSLMLESELLTEDELELIGLLVLLMEDEDELLLIDDLLDERLLRELLRLEEERGRSLHPLSYSLSSQARYIITAISARFTGWSGRPSLVVASPRTMQWSAAASMYCVYHWPGTESASCGALPVLGRAKALTSSAAISARRMSSAGRPVQGREP